MYRLTDIGRYLSMFCQHIGVSLKYPASYVVIKTVSSLNLTKNAAYNQMHQ